jgi:flagellar biosynthesis protein FlhG
VEKLDPTTDAVRGPVIVAIGSGSGGIGRTTITLELARVFSRRGVPTVVVDCSLDAPQIAAALGRAPSSRGGRADLLSPGVHLEDFVDREQGSSIGVITMADAMESPGRLMEASAEKFLERLRRLDETIAILDLPAGPQMFWKDLFAHADVPIVVSGPDGWSVRATVPFFSRLVERVHTLETGRLLRSYLLVNGCRDASERDLGEVFCHTLWRKLGHYPRYLGPVDHDDRRWFHLRHGDSCSPLSSSEGLGVQTEAIAKRILSLDDFDEVRPRPASEEPLDASWLGLSGSATATELRAQYRRLWEGYRRESAISQVLLGAEERYELITELERTYRALLTTHEEVRAATPPAQKAVPSSSPLAPKGEETAGSIEAQHEEHCGALLCRRRSEYRMTLRELSLKTRIGMRYLEAIEKMEATSLPPAVYLRGYLREIARALDLPVDSLLDRYLTELSEMRQGSSSGIGA